MIMEKIIWDGIEIYGYDFARMISYLKTLDEEYIKNLVQCTAKKGYCIFVWRDENKKHIEDSAGIDIPDGDYWSNESQFLIKKKKHKLVTDTNIVHEGTKFQIMLDELKDQSLSNAIDYWCLANRISDDIMQNDDILKVIKKLEDILKS
jgi:hypothetical protein